MVKKDLYDDLLAASEEMLKNYKNLIDNHLALITALLGMEGKSVVEIDYEVSKRVKNDNIQELGQKIFKEITTYKEAINKLPEWKYDVCILCDGVKPKHKDDCARNLIKEGF